MLFVKRLSVVVLATAAGCAPLHLGRGAASHRELTPPEQASQVLSRLTFGARPGEIDRVTRLGVDKWIHAQLQPESINDSITTSLLANLPVWSRPIADLAQLAAPVPLPQRTVSSLDTAKRRLAGDTLRLTVTKAALTPAVVRVLPPLNDQFFAGKIIRAQVSERQLQEVMADFWENHFSVYSGKMPSREALIAWDRDVLRPLALSRFRDLLGAVAHSPAMLFYLDNQNSRKRGINENYARELLELHTMGVDGGYTQADIIAVARALTGWTLTAAGASPQLATSRAFTFTPGMHDSASKIVLGHALAAGRGPEDGEEVLDIIARHPSTARFISWKIARRLVSDTPPVALVERAAATFLRTDGNITEVVRTIVTSNEFFSRAAYRAKVKTPFELVVSARRALNTPADTSPRVARLLAQLGQPMFGHLTPEGWPDDAESWVNAGSILQRIRFGTDMTANAQSRTLLTSWSLWPSLVSLSVEGQADGVIWAILGGVATSNTRDVLVATRGEPAQRLREIVALALGSPEFQRR